MKSIKSSLVSLVANCLPLSAYRAIMKSRFIGFGIETTNTCNANCTFCAYRFMERPKDTLDWALYEKTIRELSAAGGGTLNFTPTVGDPLVDNDILEKIRFAASFPNITSIFLYTNGIRLDRFGYDAVLESGLTRLAISTYVGNREGYKKYYGNDKYQKVISNILNIARENCNRGKPVLITLHLRISQEDQDWKKTPEYLELIKYLDEDQFEFRQDYDDWSGRITQADLPPGCTIEAPLSFEEKTREPCFELYRRMHVLADGNVGACVCADLEAEIKIGNVQEQSLKEIWRGPKLAAYRRNWRSGNLPTVCKTCTRYKPVSRYIGENKVPLLISALRPRFPWLFSKNAGKVSASDIQVDS